MDCQRSNGQTEILKLHCQQETVTSSFQSLSQDGSINFTVRTQVDPAKQEKQIQDRRAEDCQHFYCVILTTRPFLLLMVDAIVSVYPSSKWHL